MWNWNRKTLHSYTKFAPRAVAGYDVFVSRKMELKKYTRKKKVVKEMLLKGEHLTCYDLDLN